MRNKFGTTILHFLKARYEMVMDKQNPLVMTSLLSTCQVTFLKKT